MPGILRERFPGRRVQTTFTEKRTSGGRSTAKIARLNWQMRIRGGDTTGGKRKPEGRAVVPVTDPLTGAKSDEVHIFEVTLLMTFVETRSAVGRTGESAIEHKSSQLYWTLSQARSHYANKNVSLIHYTIVAPGPPDDATIKLVERVRDDLNKSQPPRVQITWRIVGIG